MGPALPTLTACHTRKSRAHFPVEKEMEGRKKKERESEKATRHWTSRYLNNKGIGRVEDISGW